MEEDQRLNLLMWLLLSFVSNLLQKVVANCFLTNQGWFAVVVLMIKCNNDPHPGLPKGEAHRMTLPIHVDLSIQFCREILVLGIKVSYKYNKNIRLVETRT